MCGIVGYVGNKAAGSILLEGLSKLEYRGYDSAGIAVKNNVKNTVIVKKTGKLKNLIDKTDNGNNIQGCVGIGHTRWATHGEPTKNNAHPHTSSSKASGVVDANVIGVHNGIIENYQELKEKIINNKYTLYSDTDSEIVIKLIDYYYKKYKIGPVDAISKTLVRIRGSFALVLMFKDYPDEIWVAKKDSPLIIGKGDGENFVASDAPAILNHTRKVYYLDNYELARIKADDITFYNINGDAIHKECNEITYSQDDSSKDGYEHYMFKEIQEEPKALRDTILSLVKTDRNDSILGSGFNVGDILKVTNICIVGCGSSWHVGIQSQYIIEDLVKIPVRVELASEYRYRTNCSPAGTLAIFISQSGETADTIAALRKAKENGITTLAIVNVEGSTLAREADNVIYTKAGIEVAVATTKAYSTQLLVMCCLAVKFAVIKGTISLNKSLEYYDELKKVPNKIESILRNIKKIQYYANNIFADKSMFFIGRGIDYSIALEGSLKLKEISYIHSEAYPAGELKHGTISLIENGVVVIGIITQDKLAEKTIANLNECKARGGVVGALIVEGNEKVNSIFENFFTIPKIDEHFVGLLAIVPLQLLGYYTSLAKGIDVDKPRNLAKSVTVE